MFCHFTPWLGNFLSKHVVVVFLVIIDFSVALGDGFYDQIADAGELTERNNDKVSLIELYWAKGIYLSCLNLYETWTTGGKRAVD